MSSTSDDNAIMKEVQDTHKPDGRKLAVKPILHFIEDILQPSTPDVPGFGLGTQGQQDVLDEKDFQSDFLDMIDPLTSTINQISCQIFFKLSGGSEDAHATTLEIFNILTSYEWDAKLVLALAAFAFNYGEFWLVSQPCSTNPLAKSVPLLKQLPEIEECSDTLKAKFEALSNLNKAILDVTKCIVEFREFLSQYINSDIPEMITARAYVPNAVYWTIRSIVVCTSQIMGLVGMGYQYTSSTTETLKLSSLAQEVSSIHNHLKKQLALCYQLIEEKRHIGAYQTLVELMETQDIDKMKVLRALIYAKDDQLPLLDGANRRRVSIEVLKTKIVLLLISDLNISQEELSLLKQVYRESRQHRSNEETRYEIVWFPVVNGSNPWKQANKDVGVFEILQSEIPWYSVYHHSMINPAVIKYITETWQFKKKPILVVLDSHGKVVNSNALYMLWIWGSNAFPFTRDKEEALWKKETWRFQFLVDSIDPAIPIWIAKNKCICLYGGEDIEWIRKFTTSAKAVAQAAGIPLEMLYIGKSNPQEKVSRNVSTIAVEKLSHSMQDLTSIWYFWVRLDSMRASKKRLGWDRENDPLMQEVETLLSFDESDQAWAMFCRGSAMAKASGETILQWLKDFNLWKTQVTDMDFVIALYAYNRKLSIARLMESPHIDNMNVLRALINVKKDQLPLLNSTTHRRASIEVLMRKHVLLLISDLDVSHEELIMLKQMYLELCKLPLRIESHFEFVWLPVLDRSTIWTEDKDNRFKNLQLKMPWYSVYHHPIIDPAVNMYIKEMWLFKKKPIVAVLDPQGKVVNKNALHMFRIWGSIAFPFTSAREEALWKEESWRIELLADSVDELIPIWIEKDNYICLYGGEDIEWIKKFIATSKVVAEAACIALQILYVGKHNPNETVSRNISIITKEKLSHSIKNPTFIRYFWERLESMWHSKKQLGRSVGNDPIMQEIETLLSFDRSNQTWALFCRGSVMVKAKGETILQCLEDFNSWRKHVTEKDFLTALNNYNCILPVARLLESPHKDNRNVLRALIYTKEDQLPLLDGATKTRASIEVLVRKHVLLLISDLDVSSEELSMLKHMYQELRRHPLRSESPLEFVWIPVADPWTQAKQDQFENLQLKMPWYSMYHHLLIDPAVVMYIKQVWQFKKKPILVVLDPQGNVVNKNAFHVLWIWGSIAFPFTSAREEALWKEQSWNFEFLAEIVDAAIPLWIAKGKYICLYGGEDMEWIRKFTMTSKAVAQAAHILLEMVYVGKSNPQENVRESISTIILEKLSHSLQDLTSVWYFWQRLESMWDSKKYLNRSVAYDHIIQEIDTLLHFDRTDQTWALFCKGSDMAKANGETILQCLKDFNLWKTPVNGKNFLTSLEDHLRKISLTPIKIDNTSKNQ